MRELARGRRAAALAYAAHGSAHTRTAPDHTRTAPDRDASAAAHARAAVDANAHAAADAHNTVDPAAAAYGNAITCAVVTPSFAGTSAAGGVTARSRNARRSRAADHAADGARSFDRRRGWRGSDGLERAAATASIGMAEIRAAQARRRNAASARLRSLLGHPAAGNNRLAVASNSAGCAGFARCAWKPATSACMRSSGCA